jgi:hypothetical protein
VGIGIALSDTSLNLPTLTIKSRAKALGNKDVGMRVWERGLEMRCWNLIGDRIDSPRMPGKSSDERSCVTMP